MRANRHYYVEAFDTISLAPYRISPSPFAHRYTTDETVHAVYCNRLHDHDGTPHAATVDTLPFVDKEKRLPRVAWRGSGACSR